MKRISKASNIDVVLENESVWSRFHSAGTEMIVTKQGRCMFPFCRFRLSGLDPKLKYLLLMDVVPLDDYRHRWNGETWELDGPGEPRIQSPPCFHPESPALGQYWMDGPVSFYKVKLTHGAVDQDACVALRPMHRYQPRLYIVPVSVGHCPPVSLEDPEVQMFTFTKTEFYAVTSYQNPKINQLKIDCNPFRLAFREDGEKNFRHAVTDRHQSPVNHSHRENSGSKDHISTHTFAKSESDEEEERVLSDRKMFISDQLIRCFTRGDSAPDGYVASLDDCEHTEGLKSCEVPAGSSEARRLSGKDETSGHVSMNASAPPYVSVAMPSSLHGIKAFTSHQRSANLTSSRLSDPYISRSVYCRSKRLRRARKAKSKWWSNVKYKKPAVHLSPADVSVRPDLEDVDGMLFVSFGVKEALDVHVVNMRRSMEPSSVSLAHIQTENSQSDEEVHLPLEDIISQQEIILLQHLKKQKNRQIIHPLLHNVGLKLNLLDPTVPVDLHYLGVCLPSPAVNLNLSTSSDVQFVSRARKTEDPTKINNHHFTSEQSSMDSSINRSAFFSDELEKYLESEAQQICQRAAVFSTSSPSPVVYQLPDKSSSYVRTLESVLQTRGLTAAPLTPSTDSHNLPNVLPSQSAVKRTPRNLTSSRRSRQTTPATVRNRLKPRTTRHSPKDRHPTMSSDGVEHNRPVKLQSSCSSINDCGRAAKKQRKLFEHEQEAVFHGKSRTCVTKERAKFALSSLLTSEKSETTSFGMRLVSEDVCGKDFCNLGCVCESLNRKRRGPLHCRRLQCMFGCDCFKHKVFLIHPPERGQAHIRKMQLMAFTIADPKLKCRPDPAPAVTSLWIRRSDEDDTELVFTPTVAPAPQQAVRLRVYVPRPNPVVREIEKDPVYMYLESKMTCARVREYNSNPPPQFHILPVTKNIQEPDNKTSEVSGPLPTHLMSPSSDGNPTASQVKTGDPEPTKVLEIISECNWEAQRSLVLKKLFHFIKMGLLSSSLFIDIYKVDLLSTTLKKDEGRCTLSYKVCVSLSQTSRPSDEPKKIMNERKITNEQTNVNSHQVYKCSTNQSSNEQHVRNIDDNHVPLLSRVVPAGCLKASMKTSACTRPIQVNGKTYSQAKLFLGQMGSLHPTNRLAAYVTGRMKQMCQRQSQGRLIPPAQNPSSTPNYITSCKPRLFSNIIFVPPPKPAGNASAVSPPNLDQAPVKPDVVLPAAALPPGQQVVLHPVPGVSGANICQFNGQTIQLVPLSTVLPVQIQTSSNGKGNTEQEPQTSSVQLPQMIQSTAKPRGPASSRNTFCNPLSFIAPKTLSLPGLTSISFTSGATVHSLQNGLPGKPGMFSFRICPPAKDQTGKPGETDSTILLPGGYRLIKLPSAENSPSAFIPLGPQMINKCTEKSSQDCEGPSACNDSIQTDYPVTLSKSKTLGNDRETDNSSSIEPNVEQKNQVVCCPDKDSTSRLNAMSSSCVEDTNEGPMRHKSSVHIKKDPSKIQTNCHEPEHRLVPKDVSIKIEPLESKTEPVDNPANTNTLFGINSDKTEQSDDENFVIIKVETCDETSGIDQIPDHTKNNRSPEKEDSASSHLNTDVRVQSPGNNFPVLKTEETGDGPVLSAVSRQSINGPRLTIRSFIFSDAQQDSRDNKVEILKAPFKRKQQAENSDEEDEEEAQDDGNSSVDDELSSSLNDSDNILMCFADDWTTDDGNETCSEEDIDIETYEENNERMNIFRLRAEARRKLQRAREHRRRPRDKLSGFKARRAERDAVDRASDLCVYKRAWHLNQSARKRKRRMELHQYFISLYRTVNVEEQKMNFQDVLHQARHTIEALERRCRFLMDKKKSLLQKQSNYIALISQLSAATGTVLQQAAQEKHSHKHSVVSVAKRPVGLPKVVLQSFNKI